MTDDDPRAPRTDALGPADLPLLDAIRAHDEGLRALLCTLARHGLAMHDATPQRARHWLDALASHPFYKGGQFLFDLLEWEDFMLDGDAPPVLDEAAACRVLDRLAGALRGIVAGIEPGQAAGLELAVAAAPVAADGLPTLEAKLHLFPFVVLGAIALLTQARSA